MKKKRRIKLSPELESQGVEFWSAEKIEVHIRLHVSYAHQLRMELKIRKADDLPPQKRKRLRIFPPEKLITN